MENNNTKFTTVDPAVFAQDIKNPEVYLLDVRDAEEYGAGHIEGAHNIDVTGADFLEKAENSLPKDKTVAVYCRSGKRSAMASEILSNAGYHILNLDGGITNWEEHGFPVVK